MSEIKFSLILCTINRTYDVQAFLDSLTLQTYKNFECIIVDQNNENILDEIISKYTNKLSLLHIKSNKKGLSSNRNLGFKYITGNVVCFPDDDCEYDKSTLEIVNHFFNNNDYDIYSCSVKEKNSNKTFKMPINNCKLNGNNYFNKTISIGIFIKYKNKFDISFDEKLGVGSYFGSGEESDLISNLLYKGYSGHYFGNEFIYHPVLESQISEQRYKSYSLGRGAFMKKELLYRNNYKSFVYFIFELSARFIASYLPLKKRYIYKITFKYLIKGFKEYSI